MKKAVGGVFNGPYIEERKSTQHGTTGSNSTMAKIVHGNGERRMFTTLVKILFGVCVAV